MKSPKAPILLLDFAHSTANAFSADINKNHAKAPGKALDAAA